MLGLTFRGLVCVTANMIHSVLISWKLRVLRLLSAIEEQRHVAPLDMIMALGLIRDSLCVHSWRFQSRFGSCIANGWMMSSMARPVVSKLSFAWVPGSF